MLTSLFFKGDQEIPFFSRFINVMLVGGLLSIIIWVSFIQLGSPIHWGNIADYRVNLLNGFLQTILISLVSLVISFLIGVLCGIGQTSIFLPLRPLAHLYVESIRGTPLLVQILIFFYVIAHAVQIHNRFVVGILVMSLFSGAYIAEIVRAGIQSIGESQWETARSLGLSNLQTYRYIIFPQVVTRILPPLAGQFASLIKDSSLLSIIAIKEFTMAAREMNANTFSTLEAYIPLALGYLVLTLPISYISRRLEKKYSYQT